MPPVIDAKDLHKRYPGFAPVLKGAGIQVEAGEMAAIMGPSGCGKSTMLHILGMLHAPDSGSLTILNTDVLALDREGAAAFRRENMGFVMQASNLFDHSTVFENVEFPLIYNNVPEKERWERVIRALELVRLSKRVHYRSNQLSGGEQQRVAIARAMVNNPSILMADEPTGALDAKTSRLIMENFQRLCHEGGVSMIMVTHDPNMAAYCDSIYTLEDGRLKCQKHGRNPAPAHGRAGLAKALEPVTRGALIAGAFPSAKNSQAVRLAGRLYSAGALSSVYSLKGAPFWEGGQSYSLPLAARHMGLWKRLCACALFLLHARGSSALWELWRQTPGAKKLSLWGRVMAFARGRILRRWSREDNTGFLYAAAAGKLALAAWICARLSALPYAFTVDAASLPFFSPAWEAFARDAAFVACDSKSVLNALERLLPKEPKDKFLLLRPAPPLLPEDEESPAAPPSPDKPLEILCMGPDVSASGFRLALGAARRLMGMKADFHMTVIGGASLWQRLLIKLKGLGKRLAFADAGNEGALMDAYSSASVFIACPPAYKGSELALPGYVCSAMAFGLCVIAAEMTPGMAEALEPDKNSILIPSDNPLVIAELLAHLQKRPERIEELGGAAKAAFKSLMDFQGEMRAVADRMAMASALAERGENGAKPKRV